jgi:hypothetical protein
MFDVKKQLIRMFDYDIHAGRKPPSMNIMAEHPT